MSHRIQPWLSACTHESNSKRRCENRSGMLQVSEASNQSTSFRWRRGWTPGPGATRRDAPHLDSWACRWEIIVRDDMIRRARRLEIERFACRAMVVTLLPRFSLPPTMSLPYAPADTTGRRCAQTITASRPLKSGAARSVQILMAAVVPHLPSVVSANGCPKWLHTAGPPVAVPDGSWLVLQALGMVTMDPSKLVAVTPVLDSLWPFAKRGGYRGSAGRFPGVQGSVR